MKKNKKQNQWLLPAVLILFLLEVISFPFVVHSTYAGKSESPEHILTYTPHSLVWDEDTEVRKDGSGVLSLFSAYDQNVNSDNGDKVFAPGTANDNIVRLLNHSDNQISYTAILYTVRSTGNIPVAADMSGDGTETDDVVLPDGIDEDSVVKTLCGTLDSGNFADFNIDWYWIFEESMSQDEIDTEFGNRAARGEAEDVLMGIYIVVEDDGNTYDPEAPQTGDLTTYSIVLMIISFASLVILLFERKKAEDDEE